MDGADELSEQVPPWFRPAYFTLVFFIALLAAVLRVGPVYRAPQNSAVSLVLLNCFAVTIVYLTAILLLVAVICGQPWRTISYSTIGPMVMFLVAIVFASLSNVHQRGFLNLWLRVACVLSVTDICVDYSVFLRLSKLFLLDGHGDEHEPEALALLRADTLGGIRAASQTKGSSWPFWSALKMWWRQGIPDRLPHMFVIRRKQGILRLVRIRRHIDHYAAIRALMCVARARLDEEGNRAPVSLVHLRIVTSFDHSVRTVMHERFAFLWHRVAGKSCISREKEAWWFVGAEIVQALKANCGIKFISARNFCNDVNAAWEWVARFGYEWRKPFQVGPIAVELARSQMEDPDVVVQYGLGLAGEGKQCYVPREAEQCLAIEANLVASLGLAVSANYRNLENKVQILVNSFAEILENNRAAVVGLDRSGSSAIIAISPEMWPEREVAEMIVEWISSACDESLIGYPR